jgi:hypothetical protein
MAWVRNILSSTARQLNIKVANLSLYTSYKAYGERAGMTPVIIKLGTALE